jgi:glutamine amidotransferase
MIAIVDYGVGNLFSLKSSLDKIGAQAVITAEREVLERADGIILPGVGAFEDAIAKLRKTGLDLVLCDLAAKGKPIMGICLGMQLLFEKSYEYGCHEGLSLISGRICPIRDDVSADLKIPHMGWNALHFTEPKSELFRYIDEGDYVYFVHSYYGKDCTENTIATTEYGAPLTAAVQKGNVYGCQFHPEKSGTVGLQILRAFCELGGKA